MNESISIADADITTTTTTRAAAGRSHRAHGYVQATVAWRRDISNGDFLLIWAVFSSCFLGAALPSEAAFHYHGSDRVVSSQAANFPRPTVCRPPFPFDWENKTLVGHLEGRVLTSNHQDQGASTPLSNLRLSVHHQQAVSPDHWRREQQVSHTPRHLELGKADSARAASGDSLPPSGEIVVTSPPNANKGSSSSQLANGSNSSSIIPATTSGRSNCVPRPAATHEPLSPPVSMKKMKQEASTETKEESEGQDISPVQSDVQVGSEVSNVAPVTAAAVDTMLSTAEPAAASDRISAGQSPTNTTSASSVSIVIDSAEEEVLAKLAEEEEIPEPLSVCKIVETPVQVDEEVPIANPEIKLQSILDYVKNRRHEFAKLLEEHAEIVHEINKFEGGVTS